jgi:2-dehydropantoate 2-reductase
MKIAILGAGSLGTIIGAMLSKAGLDVTLVDANKAHVEAMNKNGARVTGGTDLTSAVKACQPGDLDGTYDLVIYTVKSTFDDKALPQILPHLDKKGMLITLQNGIPEEKVASFVGRDRVLGGAVGWGAILLSPGVSELTCAPDKMTYDLGELDGTLSDRVKTVKDVLDKAGTAILTENLAGIRWTKLMVNTSFSGMSAALGCTYGDILDDDKALTAAMYIIFETILTARAAGVKMEAIQGVFPPMLLDIVATQGVPKMKELLAMVFGGNRPLKASMLQDLEKGLPCEIDSINGYLSDVSAKVGFPTPVNDQATAIIRDIQAGKKKHVFSNLDGMKLPEMDFYLKLI